MRSAIYNYNRESEVTGAWNIIYRYRSISIVWLLIFFSLSTSIVFFCVMLTCCDSLTLLFNLCMFKIYFKRVHVSPTLWWAITSGLEIFVKQIASHMGWPSLSSITPTYVYLLACIYYVYMCNVHLTSSLALLQYIALDIGLSQQTNTTEPIIYIKIIIWQGSRGNTKIWVDFAFVHKVSHLKVLQSYL